MIFNTNKISTSTHVIGRSDAGADWAGSANSIGVPSFSSVDGTSGIGSGAANGSGTPGAESKFFITTGWEKPTRDALCVTPAFDAS